MKKDYLNRAKLRSVIENSKFSMREISLRAKVSESYVKHLASGKLISPTIDKFIRVCDVLEVSPYFLVPDLEKPHLLDIDEAALEKAIAEIFEVSKSIEGLSVKQKAQLVINNYKNNLK
jgi:transcriptional regulator with XRE-family HTH domain